MILAGVFGQIGEEGPATGNVASGAVVTVTVARFVKTIEHVTLEARTLKVVLAVKFPVGKSKFPPVPVALEPTFAFVALSLNW